MDATHFVQFVIDEVGVCEARDICEPFADHLRAQGWHVAENDDDLRELALAETDLIEPE